MSLKQRGSKSNLGLMRIFDIMDDDSSQTLSLQEFNKPVATLNRE